ncbi:sigma-70 family RNA polymerase sigma factor [Jatrophihabitans sp. YIM 134969]
MAALRDAVRGVLDAESSAHALEPDEPRRGGRHLRAVGVPGRKAVEPEEPEVEDDHREVWQLVERARDGDGEAFGLIYDRYADVVYRYVFYRVGDRGLAEDLTSETFLRALRRIGSFTYQGRDIGAWLVTIARNLILDHVKSARSRLESTTDEIGLVGDHASSTVRPPTPEVLVLDSLTSAALMEAVDALNLEQRECVLLRFVQGFSVSETAAIMGKNDGAIKALQHRAVRKLATLVGDSL